MATDATRHQQIFDFRIRQVFTQFADKLANHTDIGGKLVASDVRLSLCAKSSSRTFVLITFTLNDYNNLTMINDGTIVYTQCCDY